MLMLIGLLSLLISLAALACFIMVLIKLFQEEGVGLGILGLICGLYTLVWGWQNADRLGIRQIMTIWTALIVIGTLLNFALSAMTPATPAFTPGATTMPANY